MRNREFVRRAQLICTEPTGTSQTRPTLSTKWQGPPKSSRSPPGVGRSGGNQRSGCAGGEQRVSGTHANVGKQSIQFFQALRTGGYAQNEIGSKLVGCVRVFNKTSTQTGGETNNDQLQLNSGQPHQTTNTDNNNKTYTHTCDCRHNTNKHKTQVRQKQVNRPKLTADQRSMGRMWMGTAWEGRRPSVRVLREMSRGL